MQPQSTPSKREKKEIIQHHLKEAFRKHFVGDHRDTKPERARHLPHIILLTIFKIFRFHRNIRSDPLLKPKIQTSKKTSRISTNLPSTKQNPSPRKFTKTMKRYQQSGSVPKSLKTPQVFPSPGSGQDPSNLGPSLHSSNHEAGTLGGDLTCMP